MVKGLALTIIGGTLLLLVKHLEPFYEIPEVQKTIPAFMLVAI
jgi:hypothetical protein